MAQTSGSEQLSLAIQTEVELVREPSFQAHSNLRSQMATQLTQTWVCIASIAEKLSHLESQSDIHGFVNVFFN